MEQRTCPHVGGSSCFTSYTDSLSVAVPEETSERRERSPHTSRHRAIAQIVRPSDDFDASHRVGRSPGQATDWLHLCHLQTCIWMIIALIHTGNVNLTKWSMYIPGRGKLAGGRQRRIQRWLNNPRINVHRIRKSLVKAALDDWSESKIFLALDTSLFWDEYCLVRLWVIHRGRALPLVWRVMNHESASISVTDYREMIKQAQVRLRESVKVILLAERGFIHTELMTMLTTQLGWHYRLRIKSNTWIWRGSWCQQKFEDRSMKARSFKFVRGLVPHTKEEV